MYSPLAIESGLLPASMTLGEATDAITTLVSCPEEGMGEEQVDAFTRLQGAADQDPAAVAPYAGVEVVQSENDTPSRFDRVQWAEFIGRNQMVYRGPLSYGYQKLAERIQRSSREYTEELSAAGVSERQILGAVRMGVLDAQVALELVGIMREKNAGRKLWQNSVKEEVDTRDAVGTVAPSKQGASSIGALLGVVVGALYAAMNGDMAGVPVWALVIGGCIGAADGFIEASKKNSFKNLVGQYSLGIGAVVGGFFFMCGMVYIDRDSPDLNHVGPFLFDVAAGALAGAVIGQIYCIISSQIQSVSKSHAEAVETVSRDKDALEDLESDIRHLLYARTPRLEAAAWERRVRAPKVEKARVAADAASEEAPVEADAETARRGQLRAFPGGRS